jgi:hypothetical protein
MISVLLGKTQKKIVETNGLFIKLLLKYVGYV